MQLLLFLCPGLDYSCSSVGIRMSNQDHDYLGGELNSNESSYREKDVAETVRIQSDTVASS